MIVNAVYMSDSIVVRLVQIVTPVIRRILSPVRSSSTRITVRRRSNRDDSEPHIVSPLKGVVN